MRAVEWAVRPYPPAWGSNSLQRGLPDSRRLPAPSCCGKRRRRLRLAPRQRRQPRRRRRRRALTFAACPSTAPMCARLSCRRRRACASSRRSCCSGDTARRRHSCCRLRTRRSSVSSNSCCSTRSPRSRRCGTRTAGGLSATAPLLRRAARAPMACASPCSSAHRPSSPWWATGRPCPRVRCASSTRGSRRRRRRRLRFWRRVMRRKPLWRRRSRGPTARLASSARCTSASRSWTCSGRATTWSWCCPAPLTCFPRGRWRTATAFPRAGRLLSAATVAVLALVQRGRLRRRRRPRPESGRRRVPLRRHLPPAPPLRVVPLRRHLLQIVFLLLRQQQQQQLLLLLWRRTAMTLLLQVGPPLGARCVGAGLRRW